MCQVNPIGQRIPMPASCESVFGVDRREVAAVLEAWPGLPAEVPEGFGSAAESQGVAVGNALNNLLGYPHGFHGDRFEAEVGVTEERVAAMLQRWREVSAEA